MLKIDQFTFIRDFVNEESMKNYNLVNIPIKTDNFINMQEVNDYKEINLKAYQHLIKKLMYLSYKTKPKILFIVGQLNKQNADL